MNNNLQLIQEYLYNLYKLEPSDLELLLGQTYHRKESENKNPDWDPDWWVSETYGCVIRVTEQDAVLLHNRQHNALELCFDNEYEKPLQLTVTSIANGSWTAYLPYPEGKIEPPDLAFLWSSVHAKIDNGHSFTHKKFLEITDGLGVTEYDYD